MSKEYSERIYEAYEGDDPLDAKGSHRVDATRYLLDERNPVRPRLMVGGEPVKEPFPDADFDTPSRRPLYKWSPPPGTTAYELQRLRSAWTDVVDAFKEATRPLVNWVLTVFSRITR